MCRCLCSVLSLESPYPSLCGLLTFFPFLQGVSDVSSSIRPTLLLSLPKVKSQASRPVSTAARHSPCSALSLGSLCTCLSLLLDSLVFEDRIRGSSMFGILCSIYQCLPGSVCWAITESHFTLALLISWTRQKKHKVKGC